jgi:hypothetical protein
VSGIRLVIGVIVMGIAVPIALFLLLGLTRIPQLLTIAAMTFLSWCVADVLATILSKPRLQNRSPGRAFKEDWERRANE